MTDYEDYKNNLSSSQEGDWADTQPKNNTDRTASTIELVNKIEELNKWLDLKSEYIEKMETENNKLKEQLDVKEAMIKNYTAEIEKQRQQLAIAVEALDLYRNLRGDGTLKNYESVAVKALKQIKKLDE